MILIKNIQQMIFGGETEHKHGKTNLNIDLKFVEYTVYCKRILLIILRIVRSVYYT